MRGIKSSWLKILGKGSSARYDTSPDPDPKYLIGECCFDVKSMMLNSRARIPLSVLMFMVASQRKKLQ